MRQSARTPYLYQLPTVALQNGAVACRATNRDSDAEQRPHTLLSVFIAKMLLNEPVPSTKAGACLYATRRAQTETSSRTRSSKEEIRGTELAGYTLHSNAAPILGPSRGDRNLRRLGCESPRARPARTHYGGSFWPPYTHTWRDIRWRAPRAQNKEERERELIRAEREPAGTRRDV
ncbi:hypothetical protein MRX96_043550 [Rhipicephalus microplus]